MDLLSETVKVSFCRILFFFGSSIWWRAIQNISIDVVIGWNWNVDESIKTSVLINYEFLYDSVATIGLSPLTCSKHKWYATAADMQLFLMCRRRQQMVTKLVFACMIVALHVACNFTLILSKSVFPLVCIYKSSAVTIDCYGDARKNNRIAAQ